MPATAMPWKIKKMFFYDTSADGVFF